MRALLSVYDKTGIVDFAKALKRLGWEIVATGGTLDVLLTKGVAAIPVSEVTGFPEILGGRVKTLHPKIHGGLLGRSDLADHRSEMEEHGIKPFDLLAVNLYPFEATVLKADVQLADAIEQIDVGGPTMLRAGAKNHEHILVLVNPDDYPTVILALESGRMDTIDRRGLAAKAFQHTAAYDSVIAEYLLSDSGADFPDEISFAGSKALDLRYGENPHQGAAAYRRRTVTSGSNGVLDADRLGGKELSFNNLLDADAAWTAVQGWDSPAVAIVKHAIPCGLAMRIALVDAYLCAFEGDPVSAYGGIVACNRPVDRVTAEAINPTFFEVIIAPDFGQDALDILASKRNLRLLKMAATPEFPPTGFEIRTIVGGMLVQTSDTQPDDPSTWKVMSERPPTAEEWEDLKFAWQVVRLVKSNAVVVAKQLAVCGVGSGQPNRVESVKIAGGKAGEAARGAALASDAFFPFADGVRAAAEFGIGAIVQPGGSVRDGEVIAAADEAGMAMVFTGARHFKH
jgi:phosphoribosylaminoimidazolecarboxamide formyltransferase / IMP cyclohydrolase